MRITKAASAVLLAVLLAACASAGQQFDHSHANDIRVGIHDQRQIREWFGEPYQMQAVSGSPVGAVSRWVYVHSYASFGGLKSETHTFRTYANV